MAQAKSSIGYPWILNAITKYNGETYALKPAPAQVVEFLKMPERTKECQYPGAVVHISDRQYYIRAIITREAQETLEREDEHFTLAHIKNKIVILKKFTLSFAAEEDPRCCEFYLTIQHFCIMAMEINTVDLLYCNSEPGVVKKIKELWQQFMTERQQEEAMLDSSDLSLTQLIMIASEERLGELKSFAEQCLALDSFATQEISPQARTIWSTEMRNNKSKDNNFSVPINLLLIPPEEEAALEQMSEFRPDVSPANAADNISEGSDSEGTDSSQQYNSALSSLSQEPVEDARNNPPENLWNNLQSVSVSASAQQYNSALSSLSQEPVGNACNSQPENPWNNLQSICISGSVSSGDSQHSSAQENSEKDPATDLDTTPDILSLHQDKSMRASSDSQNETPSTKHSNLESHQIQLEAKISTCTIQTVPLHSESPLPSSQRRLSDCSESLLSLIPLVQEPSSQIHTSPQRKLLALNSKLPISPILSQGPEGKHDSKVIRNLFSSNSRKNLENCHSHREWKAVKRKQAPEDLDTIVSDQEQSEPAHKDCEDAVSSSSANGETETDSNIDKKEKTTYGSCMDIKQTRTGRINKTRSPKTAATSGKTPLRKKALPYKPCIEFVNKQKKKVAENEDNALPAADLLTTSKTVSKDPSSVSQGQTSTFQAPMLQMKKTKMARYDGKPLQYKYKPPSAELCTRVKAVWMPAHLCDWAVKTLSQAKEDP